MSRNPNFAILLAAYNGSSWIAEQLQSILTQDNVEVHIFISIDKSSDDTVAICTEMSNKDSRITILPEAQNRFGGAGKNFFHLIREVDFKEFDYIAFADQDDIWLIDKLFTAHKRIEAQSCSGYSSNVTAFWADGKTALINKAQPQRRYDFLFEAAGPGCSYVLRVQEALAFKAFLIKNWDAVNDVSLHDWFIYAWFRAQKFTWFIDSAPNVLYRQHMNNQLGANQGVIAIYKRMQMIRSGWYRIEVTKTFNLLSENLPELSKNQLISSIMLRVFILRNFGQVRRRMRDTLFLFVIVMTGLY